MGEFLKNIGAITLFIDDVARTRAFYQDAFGLRVVYEDDVSVAFDFGNTTLNFLAISEAPGLIAPARVATKDDGQRMQLTIWAEDTNAVVAELLRRGLQMLNGPIDRPWGMRTACFADPDGHVWEIAQDLSKTTDS